jgi:hypothetical protein
MRRKRRRSEMGRVCGTYGRQERCLQGFGGENTRKRDHSEDPGVDGKRVSRWIFRKRVGKAWSGLIWLRIGTGGGLL